MAKKPKRPKKKKKAVSKRPKRKRKPKSKAYHLGFNYIDCGHMRDRMRGVYLIDYGMELNGKKLVYIGWTGSSFRRRGGSHLKTVRRGGAKDLTPHYNILRQIYKNGDKIKIKMYGIVDGGSKVNETEEILKMTKDPDYLLTNLLKSDGDYLATQKIWSSEYKSELKKYQIESNYKVTMDYLERISSQ